MFKVSFVLVGGVFASFMPKSESFAKALYTFDMGQNDLAQGLFTGMSIDQIKQTLPDLVNGFTDILKVIICLGSYIGSKCVKQGWYVSKYSTSDY